MRHRPGQRIAQQQAAERRDARHLQRLQISLEIERIVGQLQEVGKVKGQRQLAIRPLHQIGVGRDRPRHLGKTYLEHDQERQHKQQDQPQIGQRDHQLAAMRHLQARRPQREAARFFRP